jgi:hypothetical protein
MFCTKFHCLEKIKAIFKDEFSNIGEMVFAFGE